VGGGCGSGVGGVCLLLQAASPHDVSSKIVSRSLKPDSSMEQRVLLSTNFIPSLVFVGFWRVELISKTSPVDNIGTAEKFVKLVEESLGSVSSLRVPGLVLYPRNIEAVCFNEDEA